MKASPLGKVATYKDKYDKSLLFPIDRDENRKILGVNSDSLPFSGHDIWNAFELSWLNVKGKPEIAVCRFIIPCDSKYLIESKSFKLYLNSFNGSVFDSADEVKSILYKDISKATDSDIKIELYREREFLNFCITTPEHICLDNLDITCKDYNINSDLLCLDELTNISTEEVIYSNLLKSNCPVTGQPDWGTVIIGYKGRKISHESLLKYIVSFRNHNGFHEHCSEQIFVDLINKCDPEKLSVQAMYTRRGGLDINPIRTNDPNYKIPALVRLFRQ